MTGLNGWRAPPERLYRHGNGDGHPITHDGAVIGAGSSPSLPKAQTMTAIRELQRLSDTVFNLLGTRDPQVVSNWIAGARAALAARPSKCPGGGRGDTCENQWQ